MAAASERTQIVVPIIPRATLSRVARSPSDALPSSRLVTSVSSQPVPSRQGEHWQSRCRDGRFDRLLAKPGPGTLRVTVLGRAPVDVAFEAKPQAQVEVRLPFIASERHACVVPALCSQAALEADARRRGLGKLFLDARPEAIPFYERNGYAFNAAPLMKKDL